MKLLSPLIGQMWDLEVEKPMWTLLAKAWSAMRDQLGKDQVPLSGFLKIICSNLGMVSPEMYLQTRGWNMDVDEAGSPSISLRPDASSTGSQYEELTISVEDVISICQNQGYAQAYVSDPEASSPTFLSGIKDRRAAERKKAKDKREALKNSPAGRALDREINNFRRAYLQTCLTKIPDDTPEFMIHLRQLLIDMNAQSEPVNIPSLQELGALVAAETRSQPIDYLPEFMFDNNVAFSTTNTGPATMFDLGLSMMGPSTMDGEVSSTIGNTYLFPDENEGNDSIAFRPGADMDSTPPDFTFWTY
jgi:hypothetical protein